MAENLYVITGASGHVGSLIAKRLLDGGRRVRVVARNADPLSPLVKRGAEAATGSLDDAAFVRRAFAGAKAAFVMIPPNFAVEGFRAWQNKVADAQLEAARANGVTHVVTLSSIGGHLSKGAGPVNGLHDLEEKFNGLPANVLHLRPGYFFENMLTTLPAIKQSGMIAGAFGPDVKIPMIATRDIGEVAARRLLALDFSGHSVLELLGARDLSMRDLTRAFGHAIGKPGLEYRQFPYEASEEAMVKMGVPREMAALYMEMTRGFNEGTVQQTQPRSAQTTTPTTVEEFASEVFAPAFRAA